MNRFCIVYEQGDHRLFSQALQRFRWYRLKKSMWLVDTDGSSKDVYEHLARAGCMKQIGGLLVLPIAVDQMFSSVAAPEASEWMRTIDQGGAIEDASNLARNLMGQLAALQTLPGGIRGADPSVSPADLPRRRAWEQPYYPTSTQMPDLWLRD